MGPPDRRPLRAYGEFTWSLCPATESPRGRRAAPERTLAGLEAARARGRKGGRPSALMERDLAAAKAMLGDPEITVEEIARRLKVAPSTLYRHLPGGRSALVG